MRLIDNLAGYALNGGGGSAATPRAPSAPIQPTREDSRPSLPSGFVRRVLDLRDSMPHTTRLAQPGFVHVSSLSGICTRQWSLMLEMEMRQEETVTGAHRVMWQVGRSVENHVRNQLIDGYRGGVYGRWHCRCEATEHVGFKPRAEEECAICHSKVSIYGEVTLRDNENGVTGNPDIVLRHEEKYLPVEIKSMVDTQWDDLDSALPDHVIQAMGYRRLLQLSGRPVHDDVVLIYCRKKFKWGSPYKEYHVNAATREREALMDELFAKARVIKEHGENRTLPPRTLCTVPGSPRAKKCPVGGACFARQPVERTSTDE